MNLKDIGTQLLYVSVPITCGDSDEQKSGTGFFYSYRHDDGRNVPLVVFRSDLIDGFSEGFFDIHLANGEQPISQTVRIHFEAGFADSHRIREIGLVAMPMAPALASLDQSDREAFYKSIDRTLLPPEDDQDAPSPFESVMIIGYPSRLYDSVNALPIVRKGITSTPVWNRFQGKDCFLVDVPPTGGFDGSPVFILNQGAYVTGETVNFGTRFFFVGVLAGDSVLSDVHDRRYENAGFGVVLGAKTVANLIDAHAKSLLGIA